METTLVVPVKNEANTIQECVQSILNQTYKDFEVIFVDGGSTDGTYEILDRIRKKESRIKVLREPGLGPSYGRDLGFDAGKGEILAHIDGDNIIPEKYLEISINRLQDSNVAGIQPTLQFEYEDTLLGEALKLRRRMLYGEEPFTSEYPTVYRRSIYDLTGGLDTKLTIGEDYDLWVRLKKAAEEVQQVFVIETSAVIRNKPKERTLKEIFKHSIWYGKGIIPLLTKHQKIGLKFIAEPVFYPILICSLFVYAVRLISLFLIPILVFIMRWGIFTLRRTDRIRNLRELIITLSLIPLIRVVESLGSFVGILKHLLGRD
jgi:glycosyltransferase involved in cell wall biosynthesis